MSALLKLALAHWVRVEECSVVGKGRSPKGKLSGI